MPHNGPYVAPRNLLCLLPNTAISVGSWLPHPCGGYYEVDRWCYGPNGRIGYDMTDAPANASAFETAAFGSKTDPDPAP